MTENSDDDKKTALVTGANKGIGYEIAAGLARLGFRVGVGARDAGRREEAVGKLRAEGLDVFGVPLDVTDDASVAAAAAQLEERGRARRARQQRRRSPAGCRRSRPRSAPTRSSRSSTPTSSASSGSPTRCCRCCAAPPRRASSTCRARSARSPCRPRRPTRSGRSRRRTRRPRPTSTPITIQYAKELADTGILVNAGCPGYVATDLNGFQGFRTPEQGAAIFLELATLPDGGPTGTFRDDEGIQPW